MKKFLAVLLTGVLVAGVLTGCGGKKADDKVIKVAASATPHAELLEQVKPILAEQGYDLQITVLMIMYSLMRWWKAGSLMQIISSIFLILTALMKKKALIW